MRVHERFWTDLRPDLMTSRSVPSPCPTSGKDTCSSPVSAELTHTIDCAMTCRYWVQSETATALRPRPPMDYERGRRRVEIVTDPGRATRRENEDRDPLKGTVSNEPITGTAPPTPLPLDPTKLERFL